MSDAVLIELIKQMPALASVAAALISLVGVIIAARGLQVSRKNADQIQTLEKNTNSIKDALVEATMRQGQAEGNLRGRQEVLAETLANMTEAKPIPVVVQNPPGDPIPVKMEPPK